MLIPIWLIVLLLIPCIGIMVYLMKYARDPSAEDRLAQQAKRDELKEIRRES